jgi:hypothetical protein
MAAELIRLIDRVQGDAKRAAMREGLKAYSVAAPASVMPYSAFAVAWYHRQMELEPMRAVPPLPFADRRVIAAYAAR